MAVSAARDDQKGQTYFEKPSSVPSHEQLLLPDQQGFDSLAPPPAAPEKSSLWKWFGRSVTALGASGCIALRVASYGRWVNALSDIGAGAFTLASVSWGHKGAAMARIRQVAMTTFGMGTFFFLSQLYENTEAGSWHTAFAHTSIGLLGVNLQIVLKWLWEKRGIRVESHASTIQGHKMTELEIVPRKQAIALKILASGGAIVGRFLSNDSMVRGLCSFAASYWLTQETGALALRFINRRITSHDTSMVRKSFASLSEGTCWRTLKRVCNTVGYIALPLCFIPWDVKPDTAERLEQLVFVGLGLGFSSGFTEESEKERVKSIPVTELEELQNLDPPDREEARHKYLAWKAWHYSVSFFANAGLVGFTAWQLAVLDNTYARIAIGMTLGGFLSSYWACKYVDSKWDPAHRHVWRDRAMTNIWVAPRILGMHPLYIYLAGTNAVLMDNLALQRMNTGLPIFVALTSWGMYGISMGREIYITASDRIGNQLKWPLMLFVNAAITTKLSIAGERGVP